jgi:excisionase family DNA binding protein
MKTQLEEEDIQAIAAAVVEKLRPFSSGVQHDTSDRWLTVKKLSEYMGMSLQWIYNNKHSLPYVNMGDKPLFRKSEMDTWLEQYRVVTARPTNTPVVHATFDKEPSKRRGFNNQKRKAVTSS